MSVPTFSVIIPAYNAGKTINQTLDSVFAQTVQPTEILVYDDGSTDNTIQILKSHSERVRVFSYPNQGVHTARNFLCRQAGGSMLAFLDADDLWHPKFLEIQSQLFAFNPKAVGYFAANVNIIGSASYQFARTLELAVNPIGIEPPLFLLEYNRRPLSFQMSGFCMPRALLDKLPGEPFCPGGGEDTYLHTMLPLFGEVVHTELPLVAYRILDSSFSANQLRSALSAVDAFNRLREHYRRCSSKRLRDIFYIVSASRSRTCGKFLMSVGRASEARTQFRNALRETLNPISVVKSTILLAETQLPRFLQPAWGSPHRRLTESGKVRDNRSNK